MKNLIILTFALLTWSSANAQDCQWLNPLPQGNDLNCVRFVNENTGYAAGAAGTIMKTTDGGLTWALQHSGTTADLNSLYFTDENTGFVVGCERFYYDYILKTTDGGATWSIEPFESANWLTIYFKSSDTGYAGGRSGDHGAEILMTTDGGISWTSQVSGIDFGWVSSIFFTNKQTGYAVGSTFLKTCDGGINWTNLNNASGASVFFTDSVTGYVAGGNGTLMKTIDGGDNWTIMTTDTTYDLHSVFFTSANTGYAVGGRWGRATGIILKTSDAGATWTKQELGDVPELFSGCFTGTNTGLMVGRNGAIAKTDNGGTDWDCISEIAILKSLNSTFFLNASTGYAVGDSGTIIKTADGGHSWTVLNSGTEFSLRSVCFADEYIGYIVGDSGCFLKTTNSGNTWRFQSLGDSVTLAAVDFPTHDTGYAIGNNRVFSTIDGGIHWSSKVLVEEWYPNSPSLSSLQFVNKDTGFVLGHYYTWTTGAGFIFKTTNGGADWTVVGSCGGIWCDLTSVFFLDFNIGYAGEYSAINETSHLDLIMKTTDGGSTWTESEVDFTPGDIYFTSADTGYIISNVVQMTTDGGMTWSDNLFISQNTLNSLYFPDPGTGYIVGVEGTIVKVTSSGGTFGIKAHYAIEQSMKIVPNPTLGRSEIRYQVGGQRSAVGGNVLITLHEITGRQIKTLVDENQAPGEHIVLFDASGLPAGLYLVRLQAGDEAVTEKVVVMR